MKYITIPFILFMLLGCTTEPKIEYKTQTVTKIVYKTKTVLVPTYKPITIPNIDCNFTGTRFEPTVKLLKCLILHKRILDRLRQENNSTH